MKRCFWKYLLFAFCFVVPTALAANINELILPNGLKVLVKADHSSPSVMFQIWYKVGSSYEPNGKRGISHLLEHLMFIANDNYRLAEGFDQLNKTGARGNAFTSRDFSFFYHHLSKEHLSLAFAVEAERMRSLSPSIEQFTIEKKVVKEELHYILDKEALLSAHNALYEIAFKNDIYQFPVIGLLKDLNRLSLSEIMLWHKNYYATDNATIVVIGDVTAAEVFNLAEKYFAAIVKRKKTFKEPLSEKQLTGKQRRFILPEKKAQGGLLVAFKVPSIKTSAPLWEVYALEVLAGWLETGSHSRLTRSLIRDKQLAHDITIFYSPMQRKDSLFIIEAVPAEGVSLKRLEKALLEEIEQVKNENISASSLQIIKDQMLATDIFERDSLYTQAKIIGQAESVGIHWSEDAQYIPRITAITSQQIKQVLQKYFSTSQVFIVVQNSY